MLVLTRHPDQKIIFPTLGITLHILRSKGNAVRVGIEAPPEVRVLRDELAGGRGEAPAPAPSGKLSHALCDRLNQVTIGLSLFERQWRAGLTEEAEASLARVFAALDGLDRDYVAANVAPAAAPPVPARPHTLVVEDDHNERALLAGLLSMHGCECGTAVDGLDALRYLESRARPDFVLLDMGLPRCSGPQTLNRIRHDPRFASLKVFAISGTSQQELGIRTGPGGVDAWFAKPLNPHLLWDAIQAGLAGTPAKN